MTTGEEVWVLGDDSAHSATHIGGGVCICRDCKGHVNLIRYVHPTRMVRTLDEALEHMKRMQERTLNHIAEQQLVAATYLQPQAFNYIKEYP